MPQRLAVGRLSALLGHGCCRPQDHVDMARLQLVDQQVWRDPWRVLRAEERDLWRGLAAVSGLDSFYIPVKDKMFSEEGQEME